MSLTGYSDLVMRLKARNARTVALQFPAGLKRKAVGVASSLRSEGFQVIISGDPCYGACDLAVDTLRYADVLVHFGHTPIGDPDPRILFEPYRIDLDPSVIRKAVPFIRSRRIGLVTTAQHAHQLSDMKTALHESGIEALTCRGSRGCDEGQVLGCAFGAARIDGVDEILFIGTGIFHPTGIQLVTGHRVIALDPFTGMVQEIDAERFLRRRHALVTRVRQAEHVGLLVSTKTGQERFALARRLASRCTNAMIILMTDISPDELLNLGFPAYVNFACPRLSYDDQARFPVPVITPYEFMIILGDTDFGDYRIDELE